MTEPLFVEPPAPVDRPHPASSDDCGMCEPARPCTAHLVGYWTVVDVASRR